LNHYLDSAESDELRKINWLMMLNTDSAFKYDLKDDTSVCHLLDNFPQLSKCLYINLMWQLKLDMYFMESLKYAPSWFLIQFTDETIDSLRFSKSMDVVRQVRELVEAIYENICRMDYKAISFNSDQRVDQSIILNKMVDVITSLLRHYNTPCTEDEIAKSKIKMKEYLGFALKNLVEVVISCLRMYHQKPKFKIDEKFHIYKLLMSKEPERDNYSTKTYSSSVNDTLLCVNTILLNTLQNSVLNITLDDFMYWVEIDVEDFSNDDEDLKRDNLQKSIGEQCFELIEMINSSEWCEHDVVKQLVTISIKPKSLKEIASSATIGTVLDKIQNCTNQTSKCVWLEELLERKGALYFNTECLDTIIENIQILMPHHLFKILNDHQHHEMDAEDEQQMKKIFLNGGMGLNLSQLPSFTEELINALGIDYDLSCEHEEDDEREITNYLNKITEFNIDEESMWRLILKNPRKFYEKILKDIDNKDEPQIAAILEIITQTSSISSQYVKDIIVDNFEVSNASQKSCKHIFLSEIFKADIIERKEFLQCILIKNFSIALSNNNLQLTLMLLQTLKHICNQLKVNDLVPPIIILVAQVLDINRWDILTFSIAKEEIAELSISIIHELLKVVLVNGTKNDREWIKSKIENCKLITKFYFQKLSLEKGESIVPFEVYIYGGANVLENAPKSKILTFLCETIIRCTSKECKRLMTSEILQKSYEEALGLIAVIAGKSNQQVPLDCFKKCTTDYAKILSVRHLFY
jgi:hypothetical protein